MLKFIKKNFIFLILIIVFTIGIILYINNKNENYKDTYSQINQDRDVLEYYNHKTNGYFVDIGATNGIDISNTYLLEKKYNWKGICVEPNNEFYDKLVKNRSSYNDNSLLFSEKGKEFDFSESGEFGGITDYIDAHSGAKKNKQTKKTSETLNNILIKYNAPNNIDFLSLDTEGSELEILKGVDLNKYKFGFIAVEHNKVEPRRSDMRKYLESFGYKYLKENNWDDYYIR